MPISDEWEERRKQFKKEAALSAEELRILKESMDRHNESLKKLADK